MASDIKIIYNSGLMQGDFGYSNGDLAIEEGLETAILISLFTDRRANDDDVLPDPNNDDKKGWWGDLTTGLLGDKIGSRLWLLDRSKTDQETINNAKIYIEEALTWLIDDGVAVDFEIEVERQTHKSQEYLAFKVKILQNDGTIFAMKFDDLWQAQFS